MEWLGHFSVATNPGWTQNVILVKWFLQNPYVDSLENITKDFFGFEAHLLQSICLILIFPNQVLPFWEGLTRLFHSHPHITYKLLCKTAKWVYDYNNSGLWWFMLYASYNELLWWTYKALPRGPTLQQHHINLPTAFLVVSWWNLPN